MKYSLSNKFFHLSRPFELHYLFLNFHQFFFQFSIFSSKYYYFLISLVITIYFYSVIIFIIFVFAYFTSLTCFSFLIFCHSRIYLYLYMLSCFLELLFKFIFYLNIIALYFYLVYLCCCFSSENN